MSRSQSAPRNLTQGPIAKTLLAFALPTMGANILQSLNGSISAVWVGQFLGENALAATSNANLVMFLLYSAIFGFAMAAMVVIGQSFGRRDIAGVRMAMGTAVSLLFSIAIIVTVVGWFTAPAILHLMSTPPQVMPPALAYLRVVFLFMPASFLFILLQMGLRGTGDSLTPLIYTGLNVVLCVGLNPILIEGWGPIPRLGITGSAIAGMIANYVALIALLGHIYGKRLPIRIGRSELRYLIPNPALVRPILFKGFPMGIQMMVGSFAAIASIGLVNRHGVDTTAAFTVSAQLWAYIQMPAMAIGAAVSAMAAQNIGAGNWERVSRITHWGVRFNLLITGAAVLLLTLVNRYSVLLFLAPHSPAVPIAERINLITDWGYILFGVHFVLSGTMRANGAVAVPTVILIIALFPVRLGIAFGLTPYFGIDALWWSWPAGAAAAMLLGIIYYLSGSWRRARMAEPVGPTEAETIVIAEADHTVQLQPQSLS
jgi:putative MATE family efflux protein